jgi:hypothetical protein
LAAAEKFQSSLFKSHLGREWMTVKEAGGCLQAVSAGVRESQHIAGGERWEYTALRQHIARVAETAEHVGRHQWGGARVEKNGWKRPAAQPDIAHIGALVDAAVHDDCLAAGVRLPGEHCCQIPAGLRHQIAA